MSETITEQPGPLAMHELLAWNIQMQPNPTSSIASLTGSAEIQGIPSQEGALLNISEEFTLNFSAGPMTHRKQASFGNNEKGNSFGQFVDWLNDKKRFILNPEQVAPPPLNGLYFKPRLPQIRPITGIAMLDSANKRGYIKERVYINAFGGLVIDASHIEQTKLPYIRKGLGVPLRKIILPTETTLELVSKLSELA